MSPSLQSASFPARGPFRRRRLGASCRRRGRGITLFGMLFWAVLVAMVALLAMRVLPTLNEYFTIKRAVEQIARSEPATVADARRAFDRQREVEYSISAIAGKDLNITKENDRVVISFAYDKLVPLYGPVQLLIQYSGESR